MAKNDFLPFAIATGANVMSQDEYSELPAVSTGFVSGLASSMQINKAIRQGTVMASILAQFIVDNTGSDVLDDGDTAPILALLNQAVGNISTAHIATATGSADEITATFSPAITLSNGMVVYVRATAANTTTAPTFNPDNLGALPIVKGANVALAAGDIGGAGYWMILQYDQAFNKWVLQNPATGIDVSGKADTNLSNLSATGKTKVANLAMPSGIYIDLTLPTSGQHITAPADGYVYLEKYAANPAEYIVMQANYIGVAEAALSVNQILRVTLPVKKGSIVTPSYIASGTTTAFRFTYAEGSQP